MLLYETSMKKQLTIELVTYRRNRAFETIREIDKLLSEGMLLFAINRIYYAGFYIVSALCLLDDFSTSKHTQLIGYFNREYVKKGLIDIETGSILNLAYRKRTSVDYQDFVTVTRDEVYQYFNEMKLFVEKVDDLIEQRIKNL